MRIFKKVLGIICFCFLLINSAHAGVFWKSDSASKIIKAIKSLKKENSLVIIGLDDMIIEPKDKILQIQNRGDNKRLFDKIYLRHSQEKINFLLGRQLAQRELKLIMPEIKEIIEYANENNINVIAISTQWTGQRGEVESIEDLYRKQLKDLGVDFTGMESGKQAVWLGDYWTAREGRHPAMKHGIIFTCKMTQGEVLKAVFKELNYKPSHILYVNFSERHISSVFDFAKKSKISASGAKLSVDREEMTEYEKEIAKIQYQTLLEKAEWLNDEEAESLLKYNKTK